MRLIWSSNNPDLFKAFCNFLQKQGIEFMSEEEVNRDWGNENYGLKNSVLWIYDEDKVEKALEYLAKFKENPDAPEFTSPHVTQENIAHGSSLHLTKFLEQKLHRPLSKSSSDEQQKEQVPHIRISIFLIVLCSFIFLFEVWSERGLEQIPVVVRQTLLSTTPIKKVLLFDYPESYEMLDKIIALYGPEVLLKPKEMPPPAKFLYEEYRKEPLWIGFYPVIVNWAKEETSHTKPIEYNWHEIKLFDKIRQGQLWRFVSPILLHNDILHLFFNMIWLLLLGTQIESRIGAIRYILMMIIIAIISNTCQYLMTGPNFIGFSGVICGMATFIKVRQKIAPWEGYQMSNSTFNFICFFIGILAILSLLTFFLDVFQNISFPIAIANTAHITGAIVGIFIGRFNFFSWQVKNR